MAADANPWLVAMAGVLPGFGLTHVGLFVMGWAQISRAHIDHAEVTREVLARFGNETPAGA